MLFSLERAEISRKNYLRLPEKNLLNTVLTTVLSGDVHLTSISENEMSIYVAVCFNNLLLFYETDV